MASPKSRALAQIRVHPQMWWPAFRTPIRQGRRVVGWREPMPYVNEFKDRSLPGKARVRGRRAAQRAAR